MLKDLSYLIEMCNQKPFNDIPQFVVYKETSHFLGLWHDRDVMLKYLKELGQNNEIKSENTETLFYAVKEQRESIQNSYHKKYEAWQNP
jgi:hypothetical protein